MPNKMAVQQSVEEVGIILQNILRQVEIEEPRFSCTLNKTMRDRYDGRSAMSIYCNVCVDLNGKIMSGPAFGLNFAVGQNFIRTVLFKYT